MAHSPQAPVRMEAVNLRGRRQLKQMKKVSKPTCKKIKKIKKSLVGEIALRLPAGLVQEIHRAKMMSHGGKALVVLFSP